MTPAPSHATGRAVHRAVVVDERAEWLDVVEQTMIELGIEVVGKETSCSAALSCIDRERPDLLVIHAGEGRVEQSRAGLECLRLVREQHVQEPRAIVFGTPTEGDWVDAAFAAGAAACVVETAALEQVGSAIGQVFGQSVHFRKVLDPKTGS